MTVVTTDFILFNYVLLFCFREHEKFVEVNGRFYHEVHSKCYDCQTELDHNTMLVFDNGGVYCKDCLQKRKDQQKQQNRLDSTKALEDSKYLVGECFICQKPIFDGQVCVKLTCEMSL